jgi:hypothetical protein
MVIAIALLSVTALGCIGVDWPTGWTKPDRTIFQAEFFSMVQTAKHWFYSLRLKINYSL